MTIESIPYILLLLGSVVVASISQVLLKIESQKEHPTLISQYANPLVAISYIMLFLTTIMCVFGYRKVPLSFGIALDALSYVFAAFWGKVLFKENIGKRKLIGLALIVTGVILVGIGS